MGANNRYRWERRREIKKRMKLFSLSIFDFVILSFIFIMGFISLRLLFIFEVVKAPCAEMLMTMGQVGGNLPFFKLTYFISLLMGLFWVFVTLDRVLKGDKSWKLITWHIIIFICIFFLAIFNRSLVTQKDITPPDGTVVVEWLDTPNNQRWADYQNGLWSAWGTPACVWLDRNEIAVNDVKPPYISYTLKDMMGLGRPYIDLLAERQTYRAMTKDERERFFKKKACQKDISLYGQHRKSCAPDYWYSLPEGIKPPPHVLETWPID